MLEAMIYEAEQQQLTEPRTFATIRHRLEARDLGAVSSFLRMIVPNVEKISNVELRQAWQKEIAIVSGALLILR